MNLIGDLIGIGTDAYGASQDASASSAASTAQQEMMNSIVMPVINNMMQAYSQNYQPVQTGTSSQYQGGLGALNMGDIISAAQNYMLNPQNTMSSQVGPGLINQYGQLGSGIGALQGPAGDAFDAFMNQMPGAMSLYDTTEQHGFSPQTITSAYNNLNAQNAQQVNSIMNQLGSSMPNPAAELNQLQYQNAQSRAMLGSQLAGQSQNLMLQGANAAAGLGTQAGQNILQQVGEQANLYGQQGQMLMPQFQIAQGMDQQTLNMLNDAFNMGNNFLYGTSAFANQGNQLLNQAGNMGYNLANMYGQSAFEEAQMEQQQFQNIGSTFQNMFSMFPTGGGGGGGGYGYTPWYTGGSVGYGDIGYGG